MNVLAALAYAITKHAGQQYGPDPYWYHCLRVGSSFEDPQLQVVGLLHDIIEDTDGDLDYIAWVWGGKTATLVKWLTRKKDETYQEYIDRLCNGPTEVILVKLADIDDHLSHMRGPSTLKDRYLVAQAKLEETKHARFVRTNS